MKRLSIITFVFWVWFLWAGPAGATPLTYDFSLGQGESFRGPDRTFDLGNNLSVTLTATWHRPNLGTSGTGEIWQTFMGVGVFRTAGNTDDPNIDGRGPDETLWLTFSRPVTLTRVSFDFPHITDQFDFFSGDSLVLSNLETYPGPWTELGGGYTHRVFGIRANEHDDDFFLDGITYAPVPEPGTGVLLGVGALAMAGGLRSRRAGRVNRSRKRSS